MIAKEKKQELSLSTEEQQTTLDHEVQVAILTARIKELTEHLKKSRSSFTSWYVKDDRSEKRFTCI